MRDVTTSVITTILCGYKSDHSENRVRDLVSRRCLILLFFSVRKEESNFDRKSLIERFLSREAKLRTRTCTRTHTASNPRGLELPQYWHGLRSGASVVPIKGMIAEVGFERA
jgi:hypothetical protein